MVVLQQFKLSIEESHNANDGNAKGGGEEHFVEHLFLLVSDLGIGHMARICSPINKLDWSDNRPARPAGQIHRTAIVLSKNTAHNWQAMGPGVNPLQRSQSQRFIPLKAPGTICHLTIRTPQATPTSPVTLLQWLSTTTGQEVRMSSQQRS